MTRGRRIVGALFVVVSGLALTAARSHAAPAAGGPDAGSAVPFAFPFYAAEGPDTQRGTNAALPETVARPLVDAHAAVQAGGPLSMPPGSEPVTAAQRAAVDRTGARPHVVARTAQTRGNCAPLDLPAGRTNGELLDGDCRWGQLTGLADISYVDVYRVQLVSRSRVRMNAQSESFDVLLSLRDARYGLLADVPAAVAGGSAAIDLVLPAGTYILFVTNAGIGPVATGAYRLEATLLSPEDAPTGCAPVPMLADGTVTGNLGPSGCRGYDALPTQWIFGDAALYIVQLDKPGTLTLRVRATGHVPPRLQVLTRTGQTAIDSTFVPGDPAAATELAVALPAGHFLVLVYADAPDQVGAFELTSTFTSAVDACRPRPAEMNTDIETTLDKGCRLAHLDNGSYFNNAVDIHALTVPQDGVASIELKTEGFNAHMYILDELNQSVAGSWVDDGFRGTLPPGRYLVAVFAEGTEVGDYTLRIDFEPTGRACQVQPLVWGSPASGAIDATDCTLGEFNSIYPYDTGLDVYVVDVPTRGEIDIAMSSAVIDPYLMMLGGPLVDGPDLRYFLPSNEDYDTIRSTTARIKIPVWPGRYLVAALRSPFATGVRTGPYQLTSTFTPMAAPVCATPVLGLNAEVAAELDGTECRAFDRNRRHYSVSLQDRYRIDVPSTGVLTIELTAPTFSPRIQLSRGPYGDPLGADADPDQQGHDVLLQFALEPGTYWLDVDNVVRTRTVTGAYTVRTTFEARPTCTAITDLAPLPADVTGQLTAQDCVLGDPPLLAQLQSAVDYYRITLTEVGALTIDMTSTTIDPALFLIDTRWEIFEANANIDELDSNSQLHIDQLRPGTYIIGAISTDPGRFGNYRLRVAFEPSPLLIPTPGPAASATPSTPATPATPSATVPPQPTEPTPTARPGGEFTIHLPYATRLK